MEYRVVWEETGSVGIDEALDAGESARDMLRAVREIEDRLSADPYSTGRELSEELRIIDVLPLRAYFYIEESDLIVKITAVRRLRMRQL
jgi:hypothetical protein